MSHSLIHFTTNNELCTNLAMLFHVNMIKLSPQPEKKILNYPMQNVIIFMLMGIIKNIAVIFLQSNVLRV